MEEGARDGEPLYTVTNYLDVNDSKYNFTDLKKRIFCLRYLKKSVNKAGLRQEGSCWSSVDAFKIHFLSISWPYIVD